VTTSSELLGLIGADPIALDPTLANQEVAP
jgi:hypothetical protein